MGIEEKYLNEKSDYTTGDFYEGELIIKIKIPAMNDKIHSKMYLKNRAVLAEKLLKGKGFDIIKINTGNIK